MESIGQGQFQIVSGRHHPTAAVAIRLRWQTSPRILTTRNALTAMQDLVDYFALAVYSTAGFSCLHGLRQRPRAKLSLHGQGSQSRRIVAPRIPAAFVGSDEN